MEKDDLIKQMVEYTNIARSNNPLLELDIKKCLDALSDMGCTPEEARVLGEALHHPEKLVWKLMPPLPETPLQYDPSERDIQFVKDLISSGAKEWGVPSTAQSPERPDTALRYEINRECETFKVLVDPEIDEQRIHDKTKMILGLLGWTMIDEQASTKSYSTIIGQWILAVFDFSISTQVNPRTGQRFPMGTRGQDAVATGKSGKFMRLGPVIGAELIRHAEAVKPAQTGIGGGKTDAPGQLIKQYEKRDKDT